MINTLNVTTFNCKNLKSSVDEIREMCDRCDILVLQETWLMEHELTILSQIHSEFHGKGLSSMQSDAGILTGRPFGGLAFLWRKSIGQSVKIISYDDCRLLGLELAMTDTKLLFLNIYMPCSSSNNIEEFSLYLNKIDSIVTTADTVSSMILGDFNANLRMDDSGVINHLFGKRLLTFCEGNNLLCSDYQLLDKEKSYSFVSHAHGSTSWLDHCLTTYNMHHMIRDMYIDYSFITSDHLPMFITLNADLAKTPFSVPYQTTRSRVNWNKLSDEDIDMYKCRTNELLSKIKLDLDVVLCEDLSCKDPVHTCSISKMYNSITDALLSASSSLQVSSIDKTSQVPGWNEWCSALHREARDAFLHWRSNSSPRSGAIYDTMRMKRAHFKLALRKCKADDTRVKSDSLAKKLILRDSKSFWKEINKINRKHVVSVATTVGGASGDMNIAMMWRDHYSKLLNSSDTSSDYVKRDSVLGQLSTIGDVHSNVNHFFVDEDISLATNKLKKGTSVGPDSLSSEHIVYAHSSISRLLRIVFNCMLVHGFLPDTLMSTTLISLVKDKKGDVTDKDNYRPIAITTPLSKLLELIIMSKFGNLLDTCDNQFGFKQGHSTDQCVFVLKEVINYYNNLSSPVFACFIDASKAFDRVNHWVLFDKLLKRNVPKLFIRLMIYWYCTQSFIVKWNGSFSVTFNVTNGVRQGGVLSPKLFNVYIDDLSRILLKSNIGCYIGNTCINHLNYADDTIILAPTIFALQELLDLCVDYAKDVGILYNLKKTKCMYFKPKSYNNVHVPVISMDGFRLNFVSSHKYLGCILEPGIKDNLDIERQTKDMYIRGNMLTRNFSDCSENVKVELFRAYCCSLYGASLWCNYDIKHIKCIEVAYNNVFRSLLKIDRKSSISLCYMLAGIKHFKSLIRCCIFSLYKRVMTSENSIIQCVVSSPYFFYQSQLLNMWKDKLFIL